MQKWLEDQLPPKRSHSWVRESPIVANEGPKIAFALFIVFLVMLYSNVTVIFKQLDAFRPTLLVALGALSMMVIELGQTRQSFKLSWPQGSLLLALLGACVVSTFGAIYARRAAETTVDFGKIVLVYLLIENVVTTEARLKKVMLTMVLCGLFPALGTISNYRAGILVESSRGAWRGIFANPNEAAYGILVLIPIALALAGKVRRPTRFALWGLIGIFLLAIFLTFSRGGFVGLFVVLGLLAWKYDSILIKAGMATALVGGILLIGTFWTRTSGNFSNIKKDTSIQERFWTYQAGLMMFIHNPVLGVGPGDSLVAYPLYAPVGANCGCHDQLVIHNSYLQALGELGLLGFTPFILFILIPMYQAWKLERGPLRAEAIALGLAMWGFLVCSIFGGFTYTWWPYILVGLITAAKGIHDSKSDQTAARGSSSFSSCRKSQYGWAGY